VNEHHPEGWYWCRSCEEYLARTEFHQDKSCRLGIATLCKQCAVIQSHGITRAEYDGLLRLQGGKCAICPSKPSKFIIDHDHACCPGRRSCGRCVRGLLCQGCNLGLGAFRDSTGSLSAAAEYLRIYNEE
jgi:hypothetical protein